jgi:hypothetical protein
VAANVNGATWAASRLAFSSAREGLLPAGLSRLVAGSRLPRRAVIARLPRPGDAGRELILGSRAQDLSDAEIEEVYGGGAREAPR